MKFLISETNSLTRGLTLPHLKMKLLGKNSCSSGYSLCVLVFFYAVRLTYPLASDSWHD